MSAEWLTTAEAAARANRNKTTIHKAAECGDLHGHQRVRRGPWQFRPAAVDAWITGQSSAAACGCQHLKPVRRMARAS